MEGEHSSYYFLQYRFVLKFNGIYRWVEKSETVCGEDTKEDKATNALGVANLGGVFVVLAGGSIFAFCVSLLELIWKVGKNAREDDVSIDYSMYLFSIEL